MKKFLSTMSALFAAFLMLGAISCSVSSSGGEDAPESPETTTNPTGEQTQNTSEETAKTGTVAISVTVDGKYKCPICKSEYDTKEEAENCDEEPGCPKFKYTVTFSNSDGSAAEGSKTATIQVVNGEKIAEKDIPAWTHSDTANTYELEWTADVEGYTIDSAIKKDVTFKATWKKYYTVTFKDSVAGEGDDAIAAAADDVQKVYENEKATAPSWAKTGYTLSWNPTFDANAAVTANANYTAVWTGRNKFTVTYKDVAAYDGDTVNSDVTEEVYDGDKPAKVPTWAKTHYTLSWKNGENAATPAETEITADTTFTAVWTENRYYTVKFVDSAIKVSDSETIAAETDATNDTQKVYDGETATLPTWAGANRVNKKDYTATWTSTPSGLAPTSAITVADANVTEITFTATWEKTPTETVITFESNGSFTAAGNPTGYVSDASSKDYGKDSHITYTTAAKTPIDVRYGAKLNKSGIITLKLENKYTVAFLLGQDASKGLSIVDAASKSYTAEVDKDNAHLLSVKLDKGTYTIKNGGSETSIAAIILLK